MKEEKETPNDENKESMETQDKERSEGTEEHDEHIVSEEFQHEVLNLISEYKDSKPCLEYLRDAVNRAEDELRKKEREAEMKKMKGKKTPDSFSLEAAPY